MKKTIALILALAAVLLAGCSSKTVKFDTLGQKSVTTKTDEAAYSEAQAQAWAGYYDAIANPPVIATITQPDGSVVSINSQVPPPAPVIRQHENQYIKPITNTLKAGIHVIGGGWAIKEIADTMQGTNITNTGSGTVTVDRSDSVNVDHAEDGSTLNQGSHNDDSDRSVTDSHDSTATPTVVPAPDPVIVPAPDPVIVRPEVVEVPSTLVVE